MKKILVPTDFSENARHALTYAAEVAKLTGAEILLVHSNKKSAFALPVSEYYSIEKAEEDEYHEAAVRSLDYVIEDFKSNKVNESVVLEGRVEEGSLYSVIRNVARIENIDLVVMGTRGTDATGDFLVGSNTEKVVRTSPCTVLAVPANDKDFKLNTVVFPTTLRYEQLPAFTQLAALQAVANFDVKLLYINNPLGADDATVEANKEKLCSLSGLKVSETDVTDDVFNEEQAILAFAHQEEADMIVMATHQRQGLSHMLFGSLTEDTVNHSDIPVLCIPI